MNLDLLRPPPSMRRCRADSPIALPDRHTGATYAAVSTQGRSLAIRVLWAIGMAVRTVGLVDIAVRASKVLTPTHWFHVSRIDTQLRRAEMIDIHAVRNPANGEFISQSMDQDLSPISTAIGVNGNINLQLAVAIIERRPHPQPTRPQFWSLGRNGACFARFRRKPLCQGPRANPFIPVFQVARQLFLPHDSYRVLSVAPKGA